MNKFWNVLTGFAAAVALMPLAACDNEDYSSSPDRPDYNVNYVYLYDPVQNYTTIDFKATGDFLATLDNPLELCPVRCTKPAPEDLTVKVSIDPSLVSDYNAANKTDYDFLEGVRLTNETFVIHKGEFISDQLITMDVYDRTSLQTSAKDLILPIRIDAVTAGGTVSKSSSAIYIHFVYNANFVKVSPVYSFRLSEEDAPWTSQLDNITATGMVTADWDADVDITLVAEIDPNLLSAYIQQNGIEGVEYKFMEGARIKSPIVIKKGSRTADIQITPGNTEGLADGVRYVIPVKVTGVEGQGAALAASEYVCYIAVYVTPPTLSIGTPEGSLISYDTSLGWTMTVNGEDNVEGYYWSGLFYASGYVDGWSEDDEVTIDLQQVYTLTGVKLSFYAWYYAMDYLKNLKISADGNTWKPCEVDFSWGYTSSNNLAFDSPVEARYIKFVVGPAVYYEPAYCTGLQFYQQ